MFTGASKKTHMWPVRCLGDRQAYALNKSINYDDKLWTILALMRTFFMDGCDTLLICPVGGACDGGCRGGVRCTVPSCELPCAGLLSEGCPLLLCLPACPHPLSRPRLLSLSLSFSFSHPIIANPLLGFRYIILFFSLMLLLSCWASCSTYASSPPPFGFFTWNSKRIVDKPIKLF